MKVRFVFAQVRIKLSCFFLCILCMYNHLSGEDVFSLWYRRLAKHSSSPRIGFEFMRFWLLVQMLYHWATKDSWELRRLNQVHVTNILYTALRTIGLVSHTASEVTQSGWFCVHWLRPHYDRPSASGLKLGSQGAWVTLTHAWSKLHASHVWHAFQTSNVLQNTLKLQQRELRIFEHILVQTVVKSRFSSLSERLPLSV